MPRKDKKRDKDRGQDKEEEKPEPKEKVEPLSLGVRLWYINVSPMQSFAYSDQ